MPAHGAISAALALGALFAVGWGARVYGGRLARAQAATTRGLDAPAPLALFAARRRLPDRQSTGVAASLPVVPPLPGGGDAGRLRAGGPVAHAGRPRRGRRAPRRGDGARLRRLAHRARPQPGAALRRLRADGAHRARAARVAGRRRRAHRRRRAGPTRAQPIVRASAAPHRAAPPAGRRPAHHHRRAPVRSRRRLRLRPQHDAPPRPARRRGDAVFSRLLPGAAHLVLRVVDADVEVLPDDGAPRAGGAARHDRGGAAQLRLEDGGLLSAGRLLHRLEQAEDLLRDELRLRVRQVRVHRRPAPRRSAARLLRHGQAQALVRLGPLLRAARALRRARRVPLRLRRHRPLRQRDRLHRRRRRAAGEGGAGAAAGNDRDRGGRPRRGVRRAWRAVPRLVAL